MALDRFYFGYASNMALWVMSELCDQYQFSGVAQLDDHKLAFTRWSSGWKGGVGDVVYSPGDVVWGVLYRIGDECHDALDRKEHYEIGYTSMGIDVTLQGGLPVHCITYTVIDKELDKYLPSSAYMDTIIEAAKNANLPKDYIKFLKSVKTG